MNIEYKKFFNKNYMILRDCNIADYKECYRSKMLKNNHLNYFLVYDTQNINDQIQFTYDISSKQSLYSFYENSSMNYDMIRHLILSLKSAFDLLQNYLLEPDYLILNPEFIYLNLATKDLFFCYCPGEKNSFYDSLKVFLDYLITKINQEDRNAIVLAYSLQQHAVNPNFTFDELLEILNKSSIQETKNIPSSSEQIIQAFESDVQQPEYNFQSHLRKPTITSTIPNSKSSVFPESMETPPPVFDYSFTTQKSQNLEKNTSFSPLLFIIWSMGLILAAYLCFLSKNISFYFKCIIGSTDFLICLFTTWYISKPSKKQLSLVETIRTPSEQPDFFTDKPNEFPFFEKSDTPNPSISKSQFSYCEDTVILGYRDSNKNPRLVYTGTDFSSETEITQFPFLIGKMKENVNMVIDHVMISRIHAKIYKKENLYYIEDMNSSNGTYVNNEMIPSHTLIEIKTGDSITFSHLTYIFQ